MKCCIYYSIYINQKNKVYFKLTNHCPMLIPGETNGNGHLLVYLGKITLKPNIEIINFDIEKDFLYRGCF